MSKKKIGIPAWKTGENSVGATLSYVILAEQYGEVVFLMPNHTLREDLDLIIIPGGPDLLPTGYGVIPSWFTQKPDVQKEHFDKVYLPKYIQSGTPIVGICRGMQTLATAFGGKLIQHMNHETNKPDDPYKCVHKIKIDPVNFPGHLNFSQQSEFWVNSRHHQTVRERVLPPEMVVIARHSSDNHAEMMAHRTLPIVGTQFHFEDIFDSDTNSLMDTIVTHLIETRTSILQ